MIPKKILFFLIGVDLLLLLLHLVLGERYDIFNLDRERTPAAIWSSLKFIACGYALLTLYFSEKKQKLFWSIGSFFFMLLALDEISELHENAAYYLVKYFPPFSFFHSGTPMWVIFLSPLIIVSCILVIWMIRRAFTKRRLLGWMSSTGLLLFIIALALEFAGGMSLFWPFLPYFIPLEEGSELLAGTLFLTAFSAYARDEFSKAFQRNNAASSCK